MKYLVLLLLPALLFISCDEDIVSEEIIIEEIDEVETTLNFGSLRLGDKTQFLMFESECADFSTGITFTGDTLEWEVTSLEDGSAVLTEKFTDLSPLTDLTPYDNQIMYTSDYILMPDRFSSNLFFFYGNDTLQVDPTPSVDLIQENCSFMRESDVFIGNDIAFVSEAIVGDYSFEDMIVVSCVPGSVRDAYIVYKDGAIASIFSSDWFSGEVRGWIAVE